MTEISVEEGKRLLEHIKAKARLKYSSKEFVSLGKKRYEQIKEQVEAKNKNKFIVIEVESGDYFIDKDPVKAIVKARKKFPNAIFYRARIGYPAAFSIRSNVSLL
jgi:hypothetical protein